MILYKSKKCKTDRKCEKLDNSQQRQRAAADCIDTVVSDADHVYYGKVTTNTGQEQTVQVKTGQLICTKDQTI